MRETVRQAATMKKEAREIVRKIKGFRNDSGVNLGLGK